MKKFKKKFIPVSLLLIVSMILSVIPTYEISLASPGIVTIRQEINILDSVLSASAAAATSSEIVQLDTTQYSSPTYYFEVVASTSPSLTSVIRLKTKAGAEYASTSIPLSTTSYTRIRTASGFTPPAGQTEFVVVNDGSGSGTVNVSSARIIVIQDTSSLTNTETQIEIGNKETGKTNTATSSLTYPKYWYYDSSKWDGTKTFYAEVTWKKTDTGSSWATSTYTVSGDWNCPSGVTQATIELWGGGGGGGGGGTQTNGNGGGGGAGGQYAKKTLTSPASGLYPFVVGNGGSGRTEGLAGFQGGTTTFNTNVVVAGGGAGGGSGTGYGTGGIGSTYGCVGDAPYCYAGGNGGTGGAGYSGGGGGGAGSTGTGNSASGQTAGTAKTEYGGPGATGVTGNNVTGGSPSEGYGGGGAGGTGKTGDGGNGYAGLVRIAYESPDTSPTVTFVLQEDTDGAFGGWTDKKIIVNASTTSGTITRTRSDSFSPTNGRNYRIAAYISNGTGHSYDIYSAKIIVQQSASPTRLEPQYLLENTYNNSTGLSGHDTYFNTAEWNGVSNTYVHQIESSGSVSAKLTVPPSSDVTNSTASGTNRATSTAMTMPSTNNIDTNVLNAPISASRILVAVAPDTSPPSPSPMTWSSEPANDAAGQLSMTATTATDDTPPIYYLFTLDNSGCGSNAGTGGDSSSWQESISYTDTGLQPNKCYGYAVKARDSVTPTPNETSHSATSSTYTSANIPGTPVLSNPTLSTLDLTNDANNNPSADPITYFAVKMITGDAGWIDKWVDESGDPSVAEVWMSDNTLDSLTIRGLQADTLYGVKVKARNQNNDETDLSAEGQGSTSADTSPPSPKYETRGSLKIQGSVNFR